MVGDGGWVGEGDCFEGEGGELEADVLPGGEVEGGGGGLEEGDERVGGLG